MSGHLIHLTEKLFTAQNLNRLGMVLALLSFWFAAPELLGEQRLVRMRDLLGRGLRGLPALASGVVYSIIFFVPTFIFVFLFWTNRLGVSPYSNWTHWILGDVMEELVALLFIALAVMAELFTLDLFTRIARPLLTRLADNGRLRKNSLVFAAILFVLGFIFQLVATFF